MYKRCNCISWLGFVANYRLVLLTIIGKSFIIHGLSQTHTEPLGEHHNVTSRPRHTRRRHASNPPLSACPRRSQARKWQQVSGGVTISNAADVKVAALLTARMAVGAFEVRLEHLHLLDICAIYLKGAECAKLFYLKKKKQEKNTMKWDGADLKTMSLPHYQKVLQRLLKYRGWASDLNFWPMTLNTWRHSKQCHVRPQIQNPISDIKNKKKGFIGQDTHLFS